MYIYVLRSSSHLGVSSVYEAKKVGKEQGARPRVNLFSLPIKDKKSIPIQFLDGTVIKHLLYRAPRQKAFANARS